MAVIVDGQIVQSKNKIKKKKETIIKFRFPLGVKVWWIGPYPSYVLYDGIIVGEGEETSLVSYYGRSSKETGTKKINNKKLRNDKN